MASPRSKAVGFVSGIAGSAPARKHVAKAVDDLSPASRALLNRGIAEARAGLIAPMGDFSQYADDSDD